MLRFAAFALGLLAATASCTRSAEKVRYPRAPVVLISIDTLRSDRLPCYGYVGGGTPNIDAFRRDAILFQRAYSHCPMTLPSHASIFTGLLPTEHGVRNNIGYSFPRDRLDTLAEVFRKNGYRAAGAVSSYVLRSETGIDDGFEWYDDAIPVAAEGGSSEHQRPGQATLSAAAKWLTKNHEQPFFFFFHIYEPHAPYAPPEPYKSQHRDAYDGEVATADAITGAFLDHLRRLGIYDRAVIVLLSDHGEGLWDHGEDQHGVLLYRESLQVPLLIKLPRSERGGTTVARPAQLADVFHTLLEAGGIGKSERSLLDDSPSRPIYAETLYPRIHLGWSELRSLIDERYQYIDSPRPELYDLNRDPSEKQNLSATERRVAAARRTLLETFSAPIKPTEKIDPEEARKLAALGYIGTARARSGPLPNPRDQIGQLSEIKKGFQLAELRRYDEAETVLRELVRGNPGLSDVWSKLGEVLVESGRHHEAIDLYKTAIAQAERFSPDMALALAFAHLKQGSPRDAIAHAEVATATNPREAHELTARAHIALRSLGEARKHAERAVEAGDRQPTSLLLLAEIARESGDLEGALRGIDAAEGRARELGVRHLYGADYLRGDVLARLDRPGDARLAFEREIAQFPQHLQSYANLAIVHAIEGRRREAEGALAALVKNNPHRGARELAEKTRRALAK